LDVEKKYRKIENRLPNSEAVTTTRWMHTNEVMRAALILGIIPDYELASIYKVERLLKERLADNKVVKDKQGPHRNSPAFYAAVLDENSNLTT
jgi:hypothetical protein